MNRAAHISLQILAISKSVRQNKLRCALFSLARPACILSNLSCVSLRLRFRVCPSGAPLLRVRCFGEGVFTYCRRVPQPLFFGNVIFFSKTRFPPRKQQVAYRKFPGPDLPRNIIPCLCLARPPHLGLSTGLSPRLMRVTRLNHPIHPRLDGESPSSGRPRPPIHSKNPIHRVWKPVRIPESPTSLPPRLARRASSARIAPR